MTTTTTTTMMMMVIVWLYVGLLWSQGADDMWVSDGGGRTRCSGGPSTQTASSVSDMEFGKVERALSKKLNSTVVVYKSKTKPG